jgi:uracil-DNA glycosylase
MKADGGPLPGSAATFGLPPGWKDFGMTSTLDELGREASTCTRCRLAGGRTTVVFGVGDPGADVMFIGEGPGYHEDRQGIPFVGAAGQLLTKLLSEIGLRRDDVYICNTVKCRPPGNRDPLPDELEACRPFLEGQIENIRPRVIITLGNFATRVILARPVSISRVRGQRFTIEGRTVIPTFHPAAVLHGGGEAGPQMAALRQDFRAIREILDEPVPEPLVLQEQQALF